MKTVAVIEGFSGGPLLSKGFRKVLKENGFEPTNDRINADAIIAHSAGIYAIPNQTLAKVMILINPTYWPGKALLRRLSQHSRASLKYRLHKLGWRKLIQMRAYEIFYFVKRPRYTLLGLSNNNRLDKIINLSGKSGRKIIIVRNDNDAFSTPELNTDVRNLPIEVKALPGIHDDYYTNPKPYIDLLLKEL